MNKVMSDSMGVATQEREVRRWATKHNISKVQTRELLEILYGNLKLIKENYDGQ